MKEQYKGVNANNIYTRIQDTNTPINSTADIDKVEWLWKKRFGLIQTPIERLEIFLCYPDDWVNGPYGEMQKYYKNSPEYTITYDDSNDKGYEYYLFSQINARPHYMDIKISYHQTLLCKIRGVYLDGAYTTPCPKTGIIYIKSDCHRDAFLYRYMIKGSFLYKLYQFFFYNEYSSDGQNCREKFMNVILLFESEQERRFFEYYIVKNWDDRGKYEKSILLPCIHAPQHEGYDVDAFKDEYKHALILQRMLSDFRK